MTLVLVTDSKEKVKFKRSNVGTWRVSLTLINLPIIAQHMTLVLVTDLKAKVKFKKSNAGLLWEHWP